MCEPVPPAFTTSDILMRCRTMLRLFEATTAAIKDEEVKEADV